MVDTLEAAAPMEVEEDSIVVGGLARVIPRRPKRQARKKSPPFLWASSRRTRTQLHRRKSEERRQSGSCNTPRNLYPTSATRCFWPSTATAAAWRD